MTDIARLLDDLFGAGGGRERDDSNVGAGIGAAVGGVPRRIEAPPFRQGPSSLREEHFAQADAMAAFQRDSRRAIRRAAHAPRLPPMAGEQTAPVFPFGDAMAAVGETPSSRAARAVGVPREFVDNLIVQESSGDPDAEASTSSATGHGQFVDDTWRSMMGRYGDRYGLDAATVPDEDLLDLRRDPQWSAIMAAELARENATALRSALRRDPTHGEAYLAHFLGPRDAAALIAAAEADRLRERGRATTAVDVVNAASAEANRSIFYDGRRARSAAEVVALQSRKFSRNPFVLTNRGLAD